MRRTLGCALVVLALAGPGARAQQQGAPTAMMTVRWSDLAGDWVGNALRPANVSGVTTLTLSFGTDNKAWLKFPNREPVALRVLTMAGDSVVADAGPYASVTRAGHQVTVHIVAHVRNHMIWGTASGHFDDGGDAMVSRLKLDHKTH